MDKQHNSTDHYKLAYNGHGFQHNIVLVKVAGHNFRCFIQILWSLQNYGMQFPFGQYYTCLLCISVAVAMSQKSTGTSLYVKNKHHLCFVSFSCLYAIWYQCD